LGSPEKSEDSFADSNLRKSKAEQITMIMMTALANKKSSEGDMHLPFLISEFARYRFNYSGVWSADTCAIVDL